MLRTRFLSVAAASLFAWLGPAAPAVSEPSDATVTVTSPAADSVHPVNSSLFVRWRNDTGQEVDVWLTQGDGEGGAQRLFKLASKASSKPETELVAAVPPVPDGADYTVEVTARDTGVRGYSAPFEVGPVPADDPAVGSGSEKAASPLTWVQAQDGQSPR